MVLQTRRDSKITSNKGYSLVEVVIVMAIIVILTGLSFVTISLIGSARARAASVDFESEVADTISKSKSQVCVVDGHKEEDLYFCLRVYKQGNKFYYKNGYYNPKGTVSGDDVIIAHGDNYSSYKHIFVEGENSNHDKGLSATSKVYITYIPDGKTAADEKEISEAGEYLVFNRSGRCISGAGTYSFYKNDNKALIATVTVNKNGSHQSK